MCFLGVSHILEMLVADILTLLTLHSSVAGYELPVG
jgi:hypothetical protein